MKLKSIFDQTDFVHASGTKEELQVANYLKEQCEALGVPAKLEGFRVAMGEIEEAHLYADGMEISCKALHMLRKRKCRRRTLLYAWNRSGFRCRCKR